MSNLYSYKELQMIRCFGMMNSQEYHSPNKLYSAMMIKAFLENDKGPHVDSLRRCVSFMEKGGFRKCEEFDNLIDIPNMFHIPEIPIPLTKKEMFYSQQLVDTIDFK